MAKSYFKYQQRDAGAQINWNTVGQSVVKTLNDVVEDREKRKAELDQLSADLGDILQEQPAGTHKGANVFAQQHSSHAKEMAGIYNAALKSGRMSPKDFKMRMQALTDGTGQIFDVAEKYQAEYGKFLERTKGGANQEIERYFAERMEGFAKLNDIDSFIDPTTGQVSLGKLVEVGGLKTLSKNPGDIKSIVQLNNILSQKFDRYDLTKDLKKEVDTLGKFVRTISDETNGTIKELTDVTGGDKFEEQRKKFLRVENDVVSSIMANPYNVSSILTENLVRNPKTGKTYKITESLDGIPKEQRNDYILVTVDGNGRLVPEYTTDEGGQEEVVREAIKTKFKSMIDSERVSKRGAFAPPRETSGGQGGFGSKDESVNAYYKATKIISDAFGSGQGEMSEESIQTWNEYDDVGVLITKDKIPSEVDRLTRYLDVLTGPEDQTMNIAGEAVSVDILLDMMQGKNKDEAKRKIKSQIDQLNAAQNDKSKVFYLENSGDLSAMREKDDYREKWSGWKKSESWGSKVDPDILGKIWSGSAIPQGTSSGVGGSRKAPRYKK